MSKIKILGLAMFVVFAFSTVAAASAFAEAPVFLFNGNAITAPLPVDLTGTFTFQNTVGGSTTTFDCSGLFEGSVVGGLAEIIDVYDLLGNVAGELADNTASISCEALSLCSSGELVLVWVDNLSLSLSLTWDLNLLLEGTEFVLDFPETMGLELECKGPLGIIVETLCGGEVGAGVASAIMENEAGGIEAHLKSGELKCTKGATNGKVSGEGLIEDSAELGTLSVSEV